jgi:hypothetical protein
MPWPGVADPGMESLVNEKAEVFYGVNKPGHIFREETTKIVVPGLRWRGACDPSLVKNIVDVSQQDVLLCTVKYERCAEVSMCSRRGGSGGSSALPFFLPSLIHCLQPSRSLAAYSLFFDPPTLSPSNSYSWLPVLVLRSPKAMPTHQPKWRVPISPDRPFTLGPQVVSSRLAATRLSPNPQATNTY